MRRVVAVTGASAGLGRAIAVAFGRRGDRVGLIARTSEDLEQACAEVEAAGGRALALPADVADPQAVHAAADRLEATFGRPDIWVNAAMVTFFGELRDMSPDEFRRITEVTYLGCVNGTMEALRRMRPHDRGTIIQVGSALAFQSIPLQSAYCGAKHAIRGFTDSVRCELLHDKSRIQLSMVHMPAMNTPQFDWARTSIKRQPQPMGTIFAPRMCAEAVAWTADHPRRELLVGGPTLLTTLGSKFAPGLLQRILAAKAYEGQHTRQPIPADRPDNLFHPVAGLHGINGRFTRRAHTSSLQLWVTKNRTAVGLGMAGLTLMGLFLEESRPPRRRRRTGWLGGRGLRAGW